MINEEINEAFPTGQPSRMADARAARRRRILDNADKRIGKVIAAQVSVRKQPGSEFTDQIPALALTDSQEDGSKPSESSGLNKVEVKEDRGEPSEEFEFVDNSEVTKAASLKHEHQDLGKESEKNGEPLKRHQELKEAQDEHSAHQFIKEKPTGADDSSNEDAMNIKDRKLLRLFMLMGLAVLLVAINSFDVFSKHRSAVMKDSSFIPYFITLELINFALFPIGKGAKNPQMVLLLLRLAGVPQSKIAIIVYIFQCCLRLFEGFAIFTFTVFMSNHASSFVN